MELRSLTLCSADSRGATERNDGEAALAIGGALLTDADPFK